MTVHQRRIFLNLFNLIYFTRGYKPISLQGSIIYAESTKFGVNSDGLIVLEADEFCIHTKIERSNPKFINSKLKESIKPPNSQTLISPLMNTNSKALEIAIILDTSRRVSKQEDEGLQHPAVSLAIPLTQHPRDVPEPKSAINCMQEPRNDRPRLIITDFLRLSVASPIACAPTFLASGFFQEFELLALA